MQQKFIINQDCTTKYLLLFQNETIIEAPNIKIKNAMNSLQVHCTSHAIILRCHLQCQHSINQDIYNRWQYAINQAKATDLNSFLSVTSNVKLQI